MEKDTRDESPDQKPDSAELTRHPISCEEAVALTNEKHEFPDGAKELVGEENLGKIRSLLFDQRLAEADALLLCGYMTHEEFKQYIVLIDEMRKLRNTAYEVADSIASYIFDHHQEKIGTKIEPKPPQEPKGKLDAFIGNIIKKLRKPPTQEGPQEPETLESLMDIFYDVSNIVTSQQIQGIKTFRNALINSLMESFYAIFSIILMQSIKCKHKRHNYSDEHVKRVEATIGAMDKTWKEQFGSAFSGAFSMGMRQNAIDVIYSNDKRRRRFFSHLFQTNDLTQIPEKPVKEVEEALEQETNELFRRINDLSCFRKITPHKRKLGEEMEVHIYEDLQIESKTYTVNRAFTICLARIVLTPSAPIDLPEKRVFPDGREGILYKPNRASFEVEVNRGTGELTIRGTHLPLYCALRKDAYLILKKTIYQFILEHLEQKKDSFPDLLKAEASSVSDISREVATAIRQKRQIVSKPVGRSLESSKTAEQAETTQAPPPQQEQLDTTCFQQLRGLQGNRVYRAAETILGRPLRISGSHHVFKSRNEGTCVIALHGSDQVGIGMLKTFLDKAGIPPQEFVERI